MGIEKYFQAKGGSTSKPVKKPETKTPVAKKPATRKRKVAENNDEDDFQETGLKSKIFTTNEKTIDPKSFFGSSKPSTETVKDTTPTKKDDIVKTVPVTKEEKKPVSRKRPTITISDDDTSDDEYDNGKDDEDDYVDPEPVPTQKKLKRSSSHDNASSAKKLKPAPANQEPSKAEPTKTKPAKAESIKAKPAKAEPIKAKSAKAEPVEAEPVEEEKPKKKNNYFAMMKNKEGPKSLGSRPEPVGATNCLANKTFVISGQYETLTRDQTKDIVMRYGGKVTGAISGKTTYLLLGRDAGESKIAKAKTLKTEILDEDAFYNLVESSAPQKEEFAAPPKPSKGKDKASDTINNNVISEEQHATQTWTEKYKPTHIQEILGNKETVKKINDWLANWQTNYAKGFEGEGDDMDNWRSILLSGPPGIGKTTTASVVAKINGYEPLEFNASDVRSKKILEASISEMMDNRTMTEFFQPNAKNSKIIEPKMLQGKKVVLIMDEVDGMSGGDRGGAVELASMIKKSKIPVICICNDSRSSKVAPLLKVCYEAKYRRTPAAQIRSRILSIAFKEKLRITPNAVDELVSATHNDIRQIINILSTYRLNQEDMTFDQAKKVGKTNQKFSVLGLFEIPGALLSADSWRSKNLNEKANIYFHDYSLANLIIFENYLRCKPERARSITGNPIEEACNEMDLMSHAADAMADGDLVDSMIHGSVQQYSLMPVHSIFSCVRPASFVRGAITSRIMFPSWLGQNSKAGKYSRALADIQTRMRLKASGDKFEIRQNYIPTLNSRIFGLLEKDDMEETMEYMDNYYLDRENLDILSELTFTAPREKAPLALVPTKTKSAFTRLYNSRNHPILFQLSGVPIKKASSGPKEEVESSVVVEDEIAEVFSEDEADKADDPEVDLQNIKYIKESKKRKAAAGSGGSNKKQRVKK
ncbi:replication factor RFC1 C terminal domain-containing protein [Helicostylum pulchrum]|nr:replication factor RFC1 C terminal domain-containing protein [Helicostylum pulchrum]